MELMVKILIRICLLIKFIKESSLDRLDLLQLRLCTAILTSNLVFLLFLGCFWRHLCDIVVACFVGLEGLDLQNLEVEVREDEDLLLIEVAQFFWDYQILVRHSSLKDNRILISSKFFGDLFVEGGAGEALPVHPGLFHHQRVRNVNSSIQHSDLTLGQAGVFLAEHGEFSLNECDDGSKSLVLIRPEGLIDFLVDIVSSVQVHKTLEGRILFIFELGLNLFLLADVCYFFEEVGENIGSGKFIAFDGVINHLYVALVLLIISGCELQFFLAAYLASFFGLAHHHALNLVLEVVDVRVPVDSLNQITFGFKRIDGLAGGIRDCLDIED